MDYAVIATDWDPAFTGTTDINALMKWKWNEVLRYREAIARDALRYLRANGT
jgi:hypothetical protein